MRKNMISDIKKLLVISLAITSYVFSASFVSKAAEPLERDYIIEQLKPYWGPGPDEDDIVDPDVKILGSEDMGDHIRRHVSYMVEEVEVQDIGNGLGSRHR
jgi:hypothetical protein